LSTVRITSECSISNFSFLAEAAQALRIERGANLARPFAAVEGRYGAIEVAVAHRLTSTLASSLFAAMAMSRYLTLAAISATILTSWALRVGAGAVDEYPHRHLVFPDAVDAAGKVIFGAEGGLQKSLR